MSEERNDLPQTPERRRRPKSRLQIIKESYLPLAIAAAAVIFCLVFIIGSISRSVAKSKAEKEASIAASQSLAAEEKRLQDEVKSLLAQADLLASGYDYDGAIALLDTFSGDMTKYAELAAQKEAYNQAKTSMDMFSDIAAIPNLSFHLLIADPARAYVDENYASSYRNNFVTVSEFQKILEQLYANNYILVNLKDMVTTTTDETGATVYAVKPLYLPAGKKPIMLTETNTNYYTYMVDGDGDGLADKDGAGFASKLMVDASGAITNEYVDANGNVQTGALDLVPILESFIASHPDFSLRGARATIAVSGYDGLFGHRTDKDAQTALSPDAYQAEVNAAKTVAAALREKGYEIACYSYDNMSYSNASATEIEADLNAWNAEVLPILGQTDTLVFALNSDIGEQGTYSGDKFEVLKAAGFRYFLGYSENTTPWALTANDYVRQQRVAVTGNGLQSNPELYAAWFDAAAVLDPARNAE